MATVETTEAPEMDAETTETEISGAGNGSATSAMGKAKPKDAPIPDDPDEVRAELERARAALKKANDQAAKQRIDRNRLEELEAEKRKAETAKLSETDRIKRAVADSTARVRTLESENDALKRQNADLRIDHAVQAEAAEAGFLYPGDVPRLIDRDRVEIDPDTGKITGAKDAVARLAKDRPGLLRAQSGAGSPQAMMTRRPGAGGGGPALTAEQQQDAVTADLRRHIHYPI